MSDTPTSRRNLLVIDDDAIMRGLLPAILALEGYTVHTAESGDEALTLLSAGNAAVDIILLDLHMPGLHGADLARRLNETSAPGTLLIGMSGSEPGAEDTKLFAAFLHKPFAVEDFACAVELAAQRQAGVSGKPESTARPVAAPKESVLDETIYGRLAAILAPTQLHELYRITIEDVLHRVEHMRTSMERGDLEDCRREAHAIKGGCGMVGATELSRLAAAVETGPAAEIPPFADFAAACDRLQGMLDARF